MQTVGFISSAALASKLCSFLTLLAELTDTSHYHTLGMTYLKYVVQLMGANLQRDPTQEQAESEAPSPDKSPVKTRGRSRRFSDAAIPEDASPEPQVRALLRVQGF